jgi:hypothetical protein
MPPTCPFWQARVTLAIVRDGRIHFCQAKTDKRQMLREKADIMFVAWTGEWRTDLFEFTEKDRAEQLANNGFGPDGRAL